MVETISPKERQPHVQCRKLASRGWCSKSCRSSLWLPLTAQSPFSRSAPAAQWVWCFPLASGNAVYAYALYVWKAFWLARLAVFYPHPGAALAVWQIGLAALFVLTVSTQVWRRIVLGGKR
jgi:hypothetical protein